MVKALNKDNNLWAYANGVSPGRLGGIHALKRLLPFEYIPWHVAPCSLRDTTSLKQCSVCPEWPSVIPRCYGTWYIPWFMASTMLISFVTLMESGCGHLLYAADPHTSRSERRLNDCKIRQGLSHQNRPAWDCFVDGHCIVFHNRPLFAHSDALSAILPRPCIPP